MTVETTESRTNKPTKSVKSAEKNTPHVLFVGSYPPRRSGLAKFLDDLIESYPGPHNIVAVDEQEADITTRTYSDKIIYHFNQTDRDAYFKVANMINTGAYNVLNLQRDYGLFGERVNMFFIFYYR